MSAEFDEALRFVVGVEGGYSEDPEPTNKGIIQFEYTLWLAENKRAPRSVREITVDESKAIYKKNYWDAGRCGALPGVLGLVHFDGCVNIGVHRATILLQRVVDAKPDGVCGPRTLAAVSGRIAENGMLAVLEVLIERRVAFYRALALAREDKAQYLDGWLKRLASLKVEVAMQEGACA